MHSQFYPHVPYDLSSHYRNTITVFGQGTVKVKPDTIIMTIGVRTEHSNVQVALKEHSTITTQMIEALHNIGILNQQIETASFTIQPKYDYSDNAPVLVGYEVQHLFEITVSDVKQAGEVYETAVMNGANIASNLQFQIQNPDLAYKQALSLAMKNAAEKAYTIARSLHVTLHEPPVEIAEDPPPSSLAHSFSVKTLALASEAAPPLQSQQLTLTARVKALFSY